MNITTNYTITPDEALRGTRAFKRGWYEVSMVAGATLLLFGVYSLLASQNTKGFSLMMAFNGLIFLVMPEGVLRWARLRRGSQAYSPMEVVLDDEGLLLRTEATEGSLPWAAFARIQRRSGFWIFKISKNQAIFVPERVLDPAASAELEAFFRERKLLKA
jgi:hypothetical protein